MNNNSFRTRPSVQSRNFSTLPICAMILMSAVSNADELHFNLSEFATGYVDRTSGFFNMYQEGTFAIVPGGVAPQTHHVDWTRNALVNPDGSNPEYLLANGYSPKSKDPYGVGNDPLWRQDFTVSAGDSTFRFGGTSVLPGEYSPARIGVLVDGVINAVTQPVLTYDGGRFVDYTVDLGLLTAGSHTITMVDLNQAPVANDFALAAPVPEPAPLAVLGISIVALFRRRS